MSIAAIIVAAGSGTRLGGPVPKQYQMLGERMILTRTIEALLACPRLDQIITAISPEARTLYDKATSEIDSRRLIAPAAGGDSRAASVRNALEALAADAPDRVLIHDGARPFVTAEALENLCETEDAAILAEPVVDALWFEADGHADRPHPRDGLWRAQTPQAFPYAQILAAHRADADATTPALDDAETFRRAGHRVRLIPGAPDNFKITTAADMDRARRYLT